MADRLFHTYIVASRSRVLYTGVTGDLRRRMMEHRSGESAGFAARYRCVRLVWCEAHPDGLRAITREKEIKGWVRAKKLALIAAENPHWVDLWEELFGRTCRLRDEEHLLTQGRWRLAQAAAVEVLPCALFRKHCCFRNKHRVSF